MSTAPIIQVQNLGKCYRIHHERNGQRYHSLREVLSDRTKSVAKRLWSFISASQRFSVSASPSEDFWALKDVSFEVQAGDVIGIIGRNGAGKSTLLKILSRITEPTRGRVHLKGRVASLLEVGTGFHPELTGRENIYLNGAILGMTKSEIRKKFDEIVAFAEIEKFLDTPVKRYSSGMYVRLAFAVAAHLEPDILLVDEVLAVGDVEFQKKCLGKMEAVTHAEGRTILFVSHNMGAMQSLCNKAIYLQAGAVKAIGDTGQLIGQYLQTAAQSGNGASGDVVNLGAGIKLLGLNFSPDPVECGAPLHFRLRFSACRDVRLVELSVLFYSQHGTRVAILDFRPDGLPTSFPAGQGWEVGGKIQALPLVEGLYRIGLYINVEELAKDFFDLATLTVSGSAAKARHSPYAPMYRGILELNYSAAIRAVT